MKLGFSEGSYSYCGPKQFEVSRNADIPNRELIEKALSKFLKKKTYNTLIYKIWTTFNMKAFIVTLFQNWHKPIF